MVTLALAISFISVLLGGLAVLASLTFRSKCREIAREESEALLESAVKSFRRSTEELEAEWAVMYKKFRSCVGRMDKVSGLSNRRGTPPEEAPAPLTDRDPFALEDDQWGG